MLEFGGGQALEQGVNRADLQLGHQVAHLLPENVHQVEFEEPILALHLLVPLTDLFVYFDVHGVWVPQIVLVRVCESAWGVVGPAFLVGQLEVEFILKAFEQELPDLPERLLNKIARQVREDH